MLSSIVVAEDKVVLDAALPEGVPAESQPVVRKTRRCGTPAPDQLTRARIRLTANAFRAQNADAIRQVGPITIPVHMHVLHLNGTGLVTPERAKLQIDELNAGYAAHGVKFTLAGFTQINLKDPAVNKPQWFKMGMNTAAEMEAKSTLGVDPTRNLNIYTCEPTDPLIGGLLGYATFPWELAGNPARDGVVVLHSSVPGPGSTSPFDLGRTATHEVGHWLGLFHTFQDACQEPGDMVDDTPAQDDGNNIFECDESLDTCPAAGKDPVHNFMNYADDTCLTEFTSGQRDRMHEMTGLYRPLLIGSQERARFKMMISQ